MKNTICNSETKNKKNNVMSRITCFVLSLIIALGILASPAASHTALASESTGNPVFDAFISDPRWKNGADYGNRGPHVSNWPSIQCCAYCADWAKQIYGTDRPWDDSIAYSNVNEIRAGDIVLLQSGGSTHFFVVLKRNENGDLMTAEGNWRKKARVGWGYYSIRGNRLNGACYPFREGYHFNQAPVGCLDECSVVDNKLTIRGWGVDFDDSSASIQIHVYAGNMCFAVNADRESPDVNSEYGISGRHRFSKTINLNGISGDFNVDTYLIDSENGNNPLLKRVQCHIHDFHGGTGYVSKEPTTWSNGKWVLRCSCGATTKETIPAIKSAPIPNGRYRIASVTNSKMYVSVTPYEEREGGNISLWKKGCATQEFRFKKNYDGTYYIITPANNYVEVAGAQFKGNVSLYRKNGSDAQKWYVVDLGNGTYRLVNKAHYLNLDICCNSMNNNTNILTWINNYSNGQVFRLERIGN